MQKTNSQLLELKIQNFRSFYSEQALTFGSESANSVTAIFGANSSGKSNTGKALHFIKWFLHHSASASISNIPHDPFALRENSIHEDTKFSLRILHNCEIFEYSFSFNSEIITSERLVKITGKERKSSTVLFNRSINNKLNESAVKHGFGKHIIDSTRAETLLLTKAHENNNEHAGKVFDWLNNLNILIDTHRASGPAFEATFNLIADNDNYQKEAILLLKDADFFIQDLKFEEQDVSSEEIGSLPVPDSLKTQMLLRGVKSKKVSTLHSVRNKNDEVIGSFDFDLMTRESSGTNKFVQYLGPIIDALANGKILYLDEFGSHMHPDISNFIVKLFKSKDRNKYGAQLIVNTHETSLMPKSGALEKDDIVFVEKDYKEESQIKYLSDKGVRNDESVEKRYHQGIYGGKPYLKIEPDE